MKNYKAISPIITKIIITLFLSMLIYIAVITLYYRKVQMIMKADIQIETTRLKSAIDIYKSRTGENPNLKGFENDLYEIETENGAYNFAEIYGSEELYEIPRILKRKFDDTNEKTNKIVETRDNNGGWVYNKNTGEILPNIEQY